MILQHPDPRLRLISARVDDFAVVKRLTRDLVREAALGHERAAGLAAPQIGVLLRVAIVNLAGTWITLVNPEIVEQSELRVVGEEGCLSLPAGKRWRVERAEKVVVVYANRDGRDCTLPCSGASARVIQHEIDHLGGVLIVDRARELEAVTPDKERDQSGV